MLISCILAGTLLARLGRPEVANCIAGLKQYSYAYEEAGDQANEMNRLFNRVRNGETELNHMGSVAPRVGSSPSTNSSPHSQHGHPMVVDEQARSNGSSSHHVSRHLFLFCRLYIALHPFGPLGLSAVADNVGSAAVFFSRWSCSMLTSLQSALALLCVCRQLFKAFHIRTMSPPPALARG